MNSVIVSAKRTPVGSFQGAFANLPAPDLGATAIKAAVESAGLNTNDIDQCIMGEVLTAGVGQAPARQAALAAGLSQSTVCMTINKVCGSGLKSVMLADDAIRLGHSEFCIAGGQENMTLAPHLLEKTRAGYRMGNVIATDSMVKDGLWDPYNNFHMGNAAELCVSEYKFTREQQDDFAIESYKRAHAAQEKSWFKNEICSVEVKSRKSTLIVDTDEEPGRAKFDKIPTLRAAFDKTGTITAANASKINDGGAALVVASEEAAKAKNCKPMARIIAQSTFAQDPKWFTTAPVGAMKEALKLANLKASEIDLFEINEAFAVVTMAAIKELDLDPTKVNSHGGAIAIGHPIGASGTRIFTTLLHGLKQHNKKYGLASLCIGGGEAVAVIVENL